MQVISVVQVVGEKRNAVNLVGSVRLRNGPDPFETDRTVRHRDADLDVLLLFHCALAAIVEPQP